MTVQCVCGYKPKNYADILRHVTLIHERGSKEDHGADVSEWRIELNEDGSVKTESY